MEINGKEEGKRENSVDTRGIIKGREREKGGRENSKMPRSQKRGDNWGSRGKAECIAMVSKRRI